MPTELNRLEPLAAWLVERATGAQIVSVARILRGVMAFKFEVRTERHGSYIARFYPSGRESVADYEPQLLLRAHQAGLRVPHVVAHSGAGPICDAPYVLYAMLEGTPLDESVDRFSRKELERLASEIHAQLDILAGVSVTGFGGLVNGESAQFQTWPQLFQSAFDDFRRCDGASRAPDLYEAVVALEERVRMSSSSFPTKAELSWGDLSPDNIIVGSRNELVGLIDFEGVMAAEPILSLGYLKARYPHSPFCMALDGAFRSAHGDSEDKIAIYTILRALRIWPHLSGPLPTGRARAPLESFLPGLTAAIARAKAPTSKGGRGPLYGLA